MITFHLRNNWRPIAVAIAALGLSGTASAAAPPNPAMDLTAARAQFEAGRAGSHEATELAQQLFSQLLARDAGNPLYLAYYGSTFTLQARDSRAPWTRIKLINQGTALLDRALALLDHPPASARTVAMRPGTGTTTLETRLVAMAVFIALPETLFHRHAAAKREYQRAVASPEFHTAPPDLQGHLQYEGALIAREEGDAPAERAALQRVLALAPTSIDLAEVRARLAELH
jgi:hypothetical protein